MAGLGMLTDALTDWYLIVRAQLTFPIRRFGRVKDYQKSTCFKFAEARWLALRSLSL